MLPRLLSASAPNRSFRRRHRNIHRSAAPQYANRDCLTDGFRAKVSLDLVGILYRLAINGQHDVPHNDACLGGRTIRLQRKDDETDAAIRPGDSGGPLANTRAQVIGMDTAASVNNGLGGSANRGYAIPIQHALAIVHQIEAGQGSSTVHIGPRGMIGVQVTALSTGNGATVENVTGGSPAAKAGIKAGDTITAIDGSPVTSSDVLGTLIKAHAAGDQVTVSWTDSGGSQHNARVTLVAGPPD